MGISWFVEKKKRYLSHASVFVLLKYLRKKQTAIFLSAEKSVCAYVLSEAVMLNKQIFVCEI